MSVAIQHAGDLLGGVLAANVINGVKAELRAWNDPASVIFVGDAESMLLAALVADFPTVTRVSLQQAPTFAGAGEQRAVLLLIDDAAADLHTLPPILAALRDTAGARLVMVSDRVSLTQALALGFRRLRQTPGLYVYDLFDYKSRPEWFNARSFAHPERWDPLN